jgi:hypothetical protein
MAEAPFNPDRPALFPSWPPIRNIQIQQVADHMRPAIDNRGMHCITAMQGESMKKILQPLAWYLALTAILAMASGVALGLATDTSVAPPSTPSKTLAG